MAAKDDSSESETPFVVRLDEIGPEHGGEVGGKAANLAALTRVAEVEVPPSVCVTTSAFRVVLAGAGLDERLARLARLDPDDRDAVADLAAEIRSVLEAAPVPAEVVAALEDAVAGTEHGGTWAVRSSATAEDSATTSFAGQYDTFLDVIAPAVLAHVRRCWGSLYAERAVTYRLRHGVDQRAVGMAVVVQRLVTPDASGVLFTADPVTGDRTVCRVAAVLGLGEDLVSGVADADTWTVRDGAVLDATVAEKTLARRPAPGGGTRAEPVPAPARHTPSLAAEQVVALAALGRRVEAAFGAPQDIEWCLADGDFRLVQSRPVTTLYPVPPVDDAARHVWLSVAHQQMMTDAMTPLGLSVWQSTTPRPMAEAGNRLFVDVTSALATTATRDGLLAMMDRNDPLFADALRSALADGGIGVPDAGPPAALPAGSPPPTDWLDADPGLVEELVAENRALLDAACTEIRSHRGVARVDAVVADLATLRTLVFDRRSHRVFTTAMDAAFWLDEHLAQWLGESRAADLLTRAVPGDVTAEMGLALADVADTVRPFGAVVAYLRTAGDDLDGLARLEGGGVAQEAIGDFLARYGARCAGEIDLGRPRWSERPAAVVAMVLAQVDHEGPGAARRRFARAAEEAETFARDVVARVRDLPDGARRAADTQAMIDRLRTFMGYREYPKFGMIRRYGCYREAVLAEADVLAAAGVLAHRDDARLLRLDEFREVVRTHCVDRALLDDRRAALVAAQALVPPRVLASDGRTYEGRLGGDAPPGALVGLPVSRGVAEGRARIVADPAGLELAPGDVLVTAFTDPSFSPVFPTIAGLVTEVGGPMTHGAVVAREYGLPAVVGVGGATRRIRDGERIRVDGTTGIVQLPDQVTSS